MKKLLAIYLPSILASMSAVVWVASAVGYTLVGIKGVTGHFTDSQAYWNDRLLASQLTGTSLFALVAGITFLAAYLLWPSRAEHKTGLVLLLLAVLCGVVTIAELFILTPQDSSHAIPFTVSTALAVVAAASHLLAKVDNNL